MFILSILFVLRTAIMTIHSVIYPLRSVGTLMTLIDFTLSNARRFYSSMGNPLDMKGLTTSKTIKAASISFSSTLIL